MLYTLENREPVAYSGDVKKWTEWLFTAERDVALDENDKYSVSTVFLGCDMGFYDKPLIFETMVFENVSPESDEIIIEQIRYFSWAEAEIGHAEMVQKYLK